MEVVAETNEHYFTSIALDEHNNIVALCAASGDVVRFDEAVSTFTTLVSTETTPVGFAIDMQSQSVFLTNPTDQCVMEVVPTGSGEYSRPSSLMSKYEGRNFVGPTAVAVSPATNEIFFTDGGCEGDSSLTHCVGAVYRTVQGRKQVVPLCLNGLQQPSALAIGKDGCVYICEQASNRLLRYVPRGSYYVGAVFARFQGTMGPSAVAVNPKDGSVLVALYEPQSIGKNPYDNDDEDAAAANRDGTVIVLGRDGHEKGTILLPGSQLRGIVVDSDGANAYILHSDDVTCHSVIYRAALE